jgi:sec-independent protein translocase protein TatC
MSFLEHLDELRSRLVSGRHRLRRASSPGAGGQRPDSRFPPEADPRHLLGAGRIIFIALNRAVHGLHEGVRHRGALPVGPYILWQFWGFVAPGLYKGASRGRALHRPGTIFFVAGGAFGYYVALPITARWLLTLGAVSRPS